ncbi:hypothetical protein [Butyricimonas faecihominis]|uniref:hypothetical protein n=1 Tax=Butyricimonas faecihominis TaxID=1472416 RepID=UPI0026DDAF24|nr:hypothetical protein [Butyricimonas faecihominis]
MKPEEYLKLRCCDEHGIVTRDSICIDEAVELIRITREEAQQALQKQWISVKEQLPPVDENFLSEQSDPVLVIINQKGFYEPEILVYNKHYHVWDTADGDDFRCRVSDGDFWMAIPELKED